MIDTKKFVNNCKETLRIIENYNIPDTTRIEKAETFFKEVIIFQYKQMKFSIKQNNQYLIFSVMT